VSNVWFCSDLHIGHEKVAKDRARGHVLPRYVGAEIDWHDRILAKNWDAAVSSDDVVWVLGDISSGGSQAQRNALAWIADRPGRKRLICGNHDGVHPRNRDAHTWFRRYAEVFEHVSTSARIRIPTSDGHVTALLSHYPLRR